MDPSSEVIFKVEVQPEHDRLAFSLYGLEESMRPQAVEWLVQVGSLLYGLTEHNCHL